MTKTIIIVVLCVALLQCLIVCIGNSFTIFVFWIHRNKLKRTSFLLINLAFADLLVGPTGTLVLAKLTFSLFTGYVMFDADNNRRYEKMSSSFQSTFLTSSIFFLVLIALERAFALLRPFRHRVTSTKTYIYVQCHYCVARWNNCVCSD